ncbi:hypothetical protein Tco_0890194 [Tanacetum coccineum]|uniref:Secreted protein n=1 Tax=Tanacetum coccineum TaxID=301880 RepID=A0ABQ5C1N9_9ASTR
MALILLFFAADSPTSESSSFVIRISDGIFLRLRESVQLEATLDLPHSKKPHPERNTAPGCIIAEKDKANTSSYLMLIHPHFHSLIEKANCLLAGSCNERNVHFGSVRRAVEQQRPCCTSPPLSLQWGLLFHFWDSKQ